MEAEAEKGQPESKELRLERSLFLQHESSLVTLHS